MTRAEQAERDTNKAANLRGRLAELNVFIGTPAYYNLGSAYTAQIINERNEARAELAWMRSRGRA